MIRQHIILKFPPPASMFGQENFAAARKAWLDDCFWRLYYNPMRIIPGGVMLTVEMPPSSTSALDARIREIKDLLVAHSIVDGIWAIRDVCLRHGPDGEFCRVTVSTYVAETFDDIIPVARAAAVTRTVGASP